MSGKLTTHVLDTAHGCPGRGIHVELFRLETAARVPLTAARTNDDGRCDDPLLAGADFVVGTYELDFHVAEYFSGLGVALSEPPFLDRVTLRVGIGDPAAHYHVPLLVSPFAYSTYRGS
jgi:5-hydroxyisourate hydrolase